jgi:hypothetical protein
VRGVDDVGVDHRGRRCRLRLGCGAASEAIAVKW